MPAPGVVPTPPRVAGLLVARLRPHLPPRPVLFDPACGEGDLLLTARRELARAGQAPRALLGLELDPLRADAARRRLARHLGSRDDAPGVRILVADALAEGAPWPAGSCVIANPPWVSLSGRQTDPAARAPARARIGGWPSLQGAFLEAIARHVAREGTPAAVLLPASVVELERYGPLRLAVTRHARPLEPPLELGERAFPGVTEPAVGLLLGPRAPGAPASSAPWSEPSPRHAPLLALLADFPRLSPGSFADPGVHTGNSARALLAPTPGPGLAGVRQGRDLAPYRLGPARLYLRTDLDPAAGLRFRRAPVDRYRAFPVLLRQTADRPLAALHRPAGYFRNSLLAVRPVPDLDPAFVTAVLNGPLAAFWHRARHRDARQRSFPQVKVSHLAAQPFPIARRAEAPARHDEIAARVRALRHGGARFAAGVAAVEERVLELFGLPAEAVGEMRGELAAPPK